MKQWYGKQYLYDGSSVHMAGNNHLRAKQTGHRYPGNTECDFFLLAPLKMKKQKTKQPAGYDVSDV